MKKLLITMYIVSCFSFGFAQQPDSTWVIKNLEINSVADDYSPFLVDSMLLFTSKRRNNREDKLLEYTEKVYYTLLADTSFGKVKKFSYKANTDANSALVGVPDKYFFFYRSYFPDNGEIFAAPRKQEIRIKPLKKVRHILSDYDENSIATKGDSVYFTSNRAGNYDIYLQKGKEKPIPVEILNSPFDEISVWLSPSGKELYFSSNREGRFNIYKSIFLNGKWQEQKKLPFPINMPDWDDVDFRKYNDSIIYFASDRPGGLGGYDIYRLTKPVFVAPLDSIQQDSIPNVEIPKLDTIPNISRKIVLETPFDSLPPREQIIIKIHELVGDSLKAEVQLGAYEKYLTDIVLFKRRFFCVKDEKIRMDIFEQENRPPLRKFIIDNVFENIDEAIDKQVSIVESGCFDIEPQGSIPFIALLREGNRYAIFWSKKTSSKKEEFWILKDGEEIWRSK